MQKKQYLLLGVALAIVLALYYFGNTQGSKISSESNVQQNDQHQHDEMNHSAELASLDINELIKEAQLALSAASKTTLDKYISIAENKPSAIAFKDLAEFWEHENKLIIAAYYYKKAAFLENTEKSITFAGNLYFALLQKTEDAATKKWLALEAIECFTKALEFNPDNNDTKIALATCYTEGTGETMKGVVLLREVTSKDSTNISANIVLAKLAIQSGQLDKAINRLELVLSLRPDNTEAMYFLAEAYKGKGDKEKALSLFEQCKKLVNNPDFTKEVDNYIKTFK